MKNIIFYCLFIAGTVLQAQVKNTGSITADNIMTHINYLASDKLEGRKSGFEGQKLATAYIANEFLKAGLLSKSTDYDSAAYLQRFYLYGRLKDYIKLEYDSSTFSKPVSESSEMSVVIAVNSKKFIRYNGHAFLYYGMPLKEKDIQKRVILVKSPNTNNIKGLNSEDALFIEAESINEGLEKILQLTKTGNNKMFFLNLPFEEFGFCKEAYKTGWMMEMPKGKEIEYYTFGFGNKTQFSFNSSMKTIMGFIKANPEIRLFVVNDHIAEAFFDKKGSKLDKLKEGSFTRIKYSCDFNPEYISLPTENVLGYIEGTDKKDEVIVIGAHFDHIGVNAMGINNGADDNASGTAAVIELAKAFAEAKKQGYSPRRTILFITFTGEEEGLFGSKYYVNNPWFPMDKTVAMLNMDMIGRYNKKKTEPYYYTYLKACGDGKKYMKHQVKKVNKKNEKIKLDFHPGLIQRIGFSFGSDHYNFKKAGVPNMVFTSGFNHHDYHTPKDTPDKIKPETAAKIAQLVYLFAWELANKD
jgi:hypothetical protein